MPSKISQDALKMGLISKKQYDNLPDYLLDAISKKKMEQNKPVKNKSVKNKKK